MNTRNNRHIADFRGSCDWTMEFEVKYPRMSEQTALALQELSPSWITEAHFANRWGEHAFDDIMSAVRAAKLEEHEVVDWSFAGRNAGWFALLIRGDQDTFPPQLEQEIETIVTRYYVGYGAFVATCLQELTA